MTQTKPGEQSMRRAARQAAVAAQARRRAKTAERDKRLDAAALTLIVTLKQRDALEQRAGAAIRAMLTDGLTLADIPTWTDGETTLDRRRDHPQGSHLTLRTGRHGPSPVMSTALHVDARHIARNSCVGH